MKRTSLVLLAVTCTASACAPEQRELVMSQPYFATVLDVPDLVGEVHVSRDDGAGGTEEVTTATLLLEQGQARAMLPDLPTGVDLLITVIWRSGETRVAASAEAKSVRVKKNATAKLAFGAEDYTYPDDDGDGASNIVEVVYAADKPSEAAGAASDPGLAPPGFFTGIVGAGPLPGPNRSLDARATSDFALFTTVELRGLQQITFHNHQVHAIDMRSRSRYSITLDCPEFDIGWEVQANAGFQDSQGTYICFNKVFFLDYKELHFELLHTTQLAGLTPATVSAYSKSGRRLYAIQFTDGRVSALDVGLGSPPFQVEDELNQDLLGEGAAIEGLADTGDRLLLTDTGRDALVVVSHKADTDFELKGVALQGQLQGPGPIVLHPAGHRAYVGCNTDGKLRVIDISPEDLNEWSILATVDVSDDVTDVEIEPQHGSWVYALGHDRLVRIDTLTNQVGWQQPLGADDLAFANDISLSQDGTQGLVSAGDANGYLVLGRPEARNEESEPNEQLDQVTDTAGVVGPPPARSVGFATMAETGGVTVEQRIWNGGATGEWVEFTEDIEDLWGLDPGDATGRLAVGLMPTLPVAQQALSLVARDGKVLDTAFNAMGTTQLTPGFGVFLVTPPATELPAGVLLGVDSQDFDRTVNASYYELIVQEVPDPFPETAEVEPNNDADGAQQMIGMPMRVTGRAEASDAGAIMVYGGSEDVEDCYNVRADGSRIAVRLDFAEPADLDLLVLETDGTRIDNSYAIWGAGKTEYFAFEADLTLKSYLVCVVIDDTAPVSESDYTLTFVDFDY